jgi:hypothetical protein
MGVEAEVKRSGGAQFDGSIGWRDKCGRNLLS